MKRIKELTNGIFTENPIFVLMLGLCPTLAVSTETINGIGMGIAATFVLLCSNIIISSIKNYIPDKIRIPCYIIIIATFVTVTDLTLKAYTPALYKKMGLFIKLIVVNCIILGRAEAFASRKSVFDSILDAIGMGLGFTIALTLISVIRDILGNGAINLSLNLGDKTIGTVYYIKNMNPMIIMIMPPGAFICIGVLMGLYNKLKEKKC